MYSGKRVWNDVENGSRRRRQWRRTAQPSGPSVAMWIASGANASIAAETVFGRQTASRISG